MKKASMFLAMTALCMQVIAQQVLKTTQVNVFKNGTYYVVKEGDVNLTGETVKLLMPANPLQGTFWINSLKDVKINKVVVKTDTIHKFRTAKSYSDILMANEGKNIKLTYKFDDKTYKDVSGTLMDYYKESQIVKIKTTDNRISFIQADNIRELSFGDKTNDNSPYDSTAMVATVHFNKKMDNTRLRMFYMHTGIQWIPSYNIKIIDDKELQLEMKALIENFNEDINDAEMTLTVGNPRFYYGTATDAIALGALTYLYTTPPAGNSGYSYAQSYSYANNISNAPAPQQPVYEYNGLSEYTTTGEKTNDLYMYSLGKVSVPKNSKTSFEIFSAKVPYKDIYEVIIGDVANYSVNRYIANNPESRYDVYHSLSITNKTANPFTTGPCFVLNEKLQPLAQDELKYTAVNGDVSVQLSKAGDIVVKNVEEEVKKDENAKKVGKYYYNKITIKGTITISNLQEKKVTLTITKNLNAQVIDASDGGVPKKPGKYYSLNPYSEIKWEVPMDKNQEKKISYQYEVYVINS